MFKLLRYFSITSLIAFIIVAVLLGVFYRQLVLNELLEIAESKNVTLTRAFSNSLWPPFAPFVSSASGLSGDELRIHPEITKLHQAVLAHMEGLSVVKVKVYNLDGLTVFSTEASQIGDDKSTNPGFLSARSGQVTSELTHRDTFSAFEGEIEDRDVFSSYIPIRRAGPQGPIEGVFEVYDDVTPLIQQLERAQRNVVMGVTLILLVLYVVLFTIVRHADSIIQDQHKERKRAEEALRKARDQLEIRVAERTTELRNANEQLQLELGERTRAEEEQARLEAQLRRAQKMETIGTLAGGIAHDFNNILAPILGFVDMAMQDLPPGSSTYADLEHVLRAARRAKDLVQQILTFSRRAEQERKPVQLHLIVEEALSLIRASLPTTIEIRQSIDAKCGVVVADPTQIHQVLMNLCTNAYHAMREGGGVLEVSLDIIQVDAEFARLRPNLHEAPYVRLTVSDTGHGMDQATVERAFDPFFTTKDIGEGTGLGLSMAHGIVLSHGGEIMVYSEPGRGTTFRIYLPRAEGEVEQEIRRVEPTPKGQERILIVDDEEVIASMGKQMLERQGYEVTVSTSSLEARETFLAYPGQFDLVITDQTMPQMTGLQLAGEMRRLRPDVPIILTTGFSEAVSSLNIKELGIRAYVMKPFVTDELHQAVRKVLDQGQG